MNEQPESSIYDLAGRRAQEAGQQRGLDIAFAQALADERLAGVPIYGEVAERLRPSLQHPQRIASYTLDRYVAETAAGESYWVLKDNVRANYLRLNDEQVFIWNLLDGRYTVREISMSFMQEYKKLPLLVPKTIDLFDDAGYLLGSGIHIYAEAGQRAKAVAAERNPLTRWRKQLARFDIARTFNNMDGFITSLYNAGGHLLYRPVMLAAYLVIALVGLLLFAGYLISDRYVLIAEAESGLIGWSLVALYVAYFASVVVHELAHALTCKHYGREVRRGGFMLYFGLPAMFMDTDDMWLADRRARVMVSWAGPLSTIVIAGLCSFALYFLPTDSPVAAALYVLAFTSYLNSFFNLNPLLELDGYFMLMDWLEMPQLRNRALSFVWRKLWGKLLRHERFSRAERLFTVFGTLSIVYGVITLWLGVVFFAELTKWLAAPFGTVGDGLAYLVAVLLLLFIYRRSLRRLLAGLRPTHKPAGA